MASDMQALAESCDKWFAASEVRGLRDSDAYWASHRKGLSPPAVSLVCRARARLRMQACRSCWSATEHSQALHKHLQAALESSKEALDSSPRCAGALLTRLEVLRLAGELDLVQSLVPDDDGEFRFSRRLQSSELRVWVALNHRAVETLQAFDTKASPEAAEESALTEEGGFRPPQAVLRCEPTLWGVSEAASHAMLELQFHCRYLARVAVAVLKDEDARLEIARQARADLLKMKAQAKVLSQVRSARLDEVDVDKAALAAKAEQELLSLLEADKSKEVASACKAKAKQKAKQKAKPQQQQQQQQQQPHQQHAATAADAADGADASEAPAEVVAPKALAAQPEASRESQDAAATAEPWVEATAVRRQRKQQQQQQQPAPVHASGGPPSGALPGHARDSPPPVPARVPQAAAPAPEDAVAYPPLSAVAPEVKAAPVVVKHPKQKPPPSVQATPPPLPPPSPVPAPQAAWPPPPPVPAAPPVAPAAPALVSTPAAPLTFGSFHTTDLGSATSPPPPPPPLPPVPPVAVGVPVMPVAAPHAFSHAMAEAAFFAASVSTPRQWSPPQPHQQQHLPVPSLPMPAPPQQLALVTPMPPAVTAAAPVAAAPAAPPPVTKPCAAAAPVEPPAADVLWF
jgi:hypothetical protein